MKKLLTGFLLLILGTLLAYFIHKDPGYIHIQYADISIEMSLWLFLLFSTVAFLFLKFILNLLFNLFAIKSNFLSRKALSYPKKLLATLDEVRLLLYYDQPKKAEKKLLRLTHGQLKTLTTTLLLVDCAIAQGATDKAIHYIDEAIRSFPKDKSFLLYKKVDLLLSTRNEQHDLALLESLSAKDQTLTSVLRLKLKTMMSDFVPLTILTSLPMMYQAGLIDQIPYREALSKALIMHLKHESPLMPKDKAWKSLPKAIQKNCDIREIFESLH